MNNSRTLKTVLASILLVVTLFTFAGCQAILDALGIKDVLTIEATYVGEPVPVGGVRVCPGCEELAQGCGVCLADGSEKGLRRRHGGGGLCGEAGVPIVCRRHSSDQGTEKAEPQSAAGTERCFLRCGVLQGVQPFLRALRALVAVQVQGFIDTRQQLAGEAFAQLVLLCQRGV